MSDFGQIGVNLALESRDQDGILKELAQLAVENGNAENGKALYEALAEREKEGTTGFGNNIAVPHAKSDIVTRTGILIARSANEVQWNSIDDKPVSTWICLLTPKSGGNEHLQLLAKLSRKLMNAEFTGKLKSENEENIIALLESILN